jgi:2-polyprenyl-3-methyl-5-hydroxy-6-metoxy-1,4-benzoquinol methylase
MTETTDSRPDLYRHYVTTHLVRSRGRKMGVKYFPVLHGLPQNHSARVLDIGCGSGEVVEEITRAGFTDVVGIDISQEQVELAHSLGRTQVIQADVFAYLGEHPGSCDAIVASDVLEHFDRDEVVNLLAAIYQALAPGSVFVAQVPNATSPFFGNYAYGDFTHRSVFTARSIHQICLSAGFETAVVRPVNPHAHGLVSGIRRTIWSVISGFLKLALASETGGLRGNIVTQNVYFVATKPRA